MTVDLDLLADYAEGLLEPPDQARVESLVHSDRDWATALDALRVALPSVTAALASVDHERMPATVLAASLHAVAADSDRAGRPADEKRDATRPAAGRPPKARTRRRPSAPALAAFALVAVVLVGCGFLVNGLARAGNDNSSAPAAKAVAPEAAPGLAGQSPVKIITSGTDYTRVTLPRAFGTNLQSLASPDFNATSSVPGPTRAPVPPGLDRLVPQAALDACIEQVDATLGGRAATVDYASFEGTPALIITVPTIHAVIAVGANCGANGFGIDELARS